MLTKQPKPRKCKSCGELFKPFSTTAKACSMSCALDLAGKETQKKIEKERRRIEKEKRLKEKEYDQITREMRKAANENSLSWWAKKTEEKCNEYIRLRDKDQPCISCGNTNPLIKYDAGHFVPVGRSKTLRYEETNIHKQCSKNCNTSKSGNYIEYRKALVKKYGAEHVEWLEFDHPTPRRRIEDYKAIYEHYKAKIKQLKVQS